MVSIENVLTSSSGDGQIEEGEVKVEIYVTTTIPIHSYSFTLEGFGYDHVIHDPYDVIEQESGTFNFQNHVLMNWSLIKKKISVFKRQQNIYVVRKNFRIAEN